MRIPASLALVSLALSACVPVVAGGAVAGSAVTVSREKSFGREVDDYSIATKIRARFVNADVNDLLSGVGIEVDEGRVLLTGRVASQQTKMRATEIAWKVEGVKEVINEVQVNEANATRNLATDSWITSEIRTKILFDKNIRGVNYSIETVDAVVYIFGIAQDQQELDKVTQICRTTKYVKEVVSHAVLKTDPRRK